MRYFYQINQDEIFSIKHRGHGFEIELFDQALTDEANANRKSYLQPIKKYSKHYMDAYGRIYDEILEEMPDDYVLVDEISLVKREKLEDEFKNKINHFNNIVHEKSGTEFEVIDIFANGKLLVFDTRRRVLKNPYVLFDEEGNQISGYFEAPDEEFSDGWLSVAISRENGRFESFERNWINENGKWFDESKNYVNASSFRGGFATYGSGVFLEEDKSQHFEKAILADGREFKNEYDVIGRFRDDLPLVFLPDSADDRDIGKYYVIDKDENVLSLKGFRTLGSESDGISTYTVQGGKMSYLKTRERKAKSGELILKIVSGKVPPVQVQAVGGERIFDFVPFKEKFDSVSKFEGGFGIVENYIKTRLGTRSVIEKRIYDIIGKDEVKISEISKFVEKFDSKQANIEDAPVDFAKNSRFYSNIFSDEIDYFEAIYNELVDAHASQNEIDHYSRILLYLTGEDRVYKAKLENGLLLGKMNS
ncbi:MAG: hypothetical protein IJ538_01640 [Clostridia bacterium]|nr:hypothetical protein [Clostridia bacterium]